MAHLQARRFVRDVRELSLRRTQMRPKCDHEPPESPCEERRGPAVASRPAPSHVSCLQRETARSGKEMSAPGEIRTPDLRFRRPSLDATSWCLIRIEAPCRSRPAPRLLK